MFNSRISGLFLFSVLLLFFSGFCFSLFAETSSPDETFPLSPFQLPEGEDELSLGGDREGNVYALGGDMIVSSGISGDLYAAGMALRVLDAVSGDVGFLGRSGIFETGTISGDVRMVGLAVEVYSVILGEILFVGSDLLVGEDAHVQDDVMVFADTVTLDGQVDGNVWGFVDTMVIGGQINGDVDVSASDTIVIAEDAVVAGDFRYSGVSRESLILLPGAEVRGETTFTESLSGRGSWSPFREFFFLLIAGLLSYIALQGRWHFYTIRRPVSALLDLGIGFVISIFLCLLSIFIITLPGLFLVGLAVFAALLALQLFGVLVAPVLFGSLLLQAYRRGECEVTIHSTMLGIGVLFILSILFIPFLVVLLFSSFYFVGVTARHLYFRRFSR